MLSLDDYNSLCGKLPAASHVVQWGGSHVWKVGGKVFAIAGLHGKPDGEGEPGALYITFKVTDMAWEMYRDAPGLRPAPYLASRGMKWLQRTGEATMDDAMLADYIAQSHQLVVANLTLRQRRELDL